MNFDLMRSLLIDRALRGELFSNSNSIAAEEKTLNEVKETPFTIPNNWQWKRVADCVQFNPKVIQDDAAEVSFIPMADVEPGFVDHCSTRQIKLWAKVKKGFSRFQEGDLLVAKITPCFQNRKSCVANNLISGTGAGSTEFHVMRCVSDVDAKFLLYFFKSEYFIRYGVNHFNGTVGQQRVGAQDIKDCLIPVPPFDEQTRIVEKLEEAFAEIARAEKAYEELQTLAGVLRGQILQEAIQGKLVPQLVSDGVTKQIAEAPEEVPFDIPNTWSWIRGEELAVKRKTIDPSTLTNDEIELWSIPAYDAGVAEKVSPGDIGSSKKVVQVGDVLLAKIVPHIKRVWVVSESANSLMKLASTEWLVYASELFLPEFMGLLFRSPYFRTKMMESVSGMGSLKRANPRTLAKVWLPVPPIKEQERIVIKVETLLKQVNLLLTK